MVEEIKKVENGYRITTDKGEFFLDFSKMNEIIGFKDDVVFGHGDGNLVSLNIVTDDYELWTPYKDKPYKLFEIELCTSLCYFQCETEDEEEVYEPVFEYLKKCPTCNYIQELTALLINEYIKLRMKKKLDMVSLSYFRQITFHLKILQICTINIIPSLNMCCSLQE